MVVQIVETYVPCVGSLLFEPAFRVVIRKIDVTQTLSAMSKEKAAKKGKDLQAPQSKDHHQT